MGPLTGVRAIEIAGIGPGPFCGMMLADMGAEVIRVDRAGSVSGGDPSAPPADVLARGRKSIGVDLKSPAGVETVMRLVDGAEIFFEGFRPGVAERLGIGPDDVLGRNASIVYGRMTGFGQDGPYASMAGHDINYIALAGVLDGIGTAEGGPIPPLNLIGDFGGGGMLLAFGLVSGVLHARSTGDGQVVDAAMVDGAATLNAFFYGMHAMGVHRLEREANMLDGGAHFYGAFECADGEYIALGSIETQFYAELIETLGLADEDLPAQNDRSAWASMRDRIGSIIATRTRDEWETVMGGTDICFAPVLDLVEATEHPHNVARGTFTEVAGVVQPAPAPRFSATPGSIERPPAHPGQHTDEILIDAGLDGAEIAALRDSGAVA